MRNIVVSVVISLIILFSLFLIAQDQIRGPKSTKEITVSKSSVPTPVNINLDSNFNNFKDQSKLTFDKLHCELYEEKSMIGDIQTNMSILEGKLILRSTMQRHQNCYYPWSKRLTRWRHRRVFSKVFFDWFRSQTLQAYED